jgi:hypothetical protein
LRYGVRWCWFLDAAGAAAWAGRWSALLNLLPWWILRGQRGRERKRERRMVPAEPWQEPRRRMYLPFPSSHALGVTPFSISTRSSIISLSCGKFAWQRREDEGARSASDSCGQAEHPRWTIGADDAVGLQDCRCGPANDQIPRIAMHSEAPLIHPPSLARWRSFLAHCVCTICSYRGTERFVPYRVLFTGCACGRKRPAGRRAGAEIAEVASQVPGIRLRRRPSNFVETIIAFHFL